MRQHYLGVIPFAVNGMLTWKRDVRKGQLPRMRKLPRIVNVRDDRARLGLVSTENMWL